jgi:PEGA domain
MSRVELIVAATAVIMGVALGGCSGSMPEWMSTSPPQSAGPQNQALRFESDPPGAEVRTVKGETCQTPCALAVPTDNQSVSFAKEGFEPQTVQVIARESTNQSYFSGMFNGSPRTLAPNPVQVVMIEVPPPPKAKHHKSVSSVPRTRTATKMTPPPAPPPITPSEPMAQPASAQPASSPFPPPPQQPASSPFPPPPTH